MNSAATTNPIHERLNPSPEMTLAAWLKEEAKAGRQLTVKEFVSRMASGHPAGASHVSVRVHRANVKQLIKLGERSAA